MKNTKLIALVAVLVVVSLVVSIAVALGNDKKGFGEIDTTIKNYEQQIAELNKTIEELNKGLISSTEALEKLQAAGVEIKNWNEASAVLVEKLAELVEAGKEFVVSVQTYDEKDEEKKNPLVTVKEIYGATFEEHEEFLKLTGDAEMDLMRATSVAEMNTIIANYKADLAEVPTLLEQYISNLEAVEKDGKVTYDEYETIKLAIELAGKVSDKVYAPAAEGEKKGQKELLAERLEALMTEFKPLAVAKFVELVNALPEVELLAPSHYEAVEAAQAQAKFVLEDLYKNDDSSIKVEGKKNKATAYAKALDTLAEVEDRIVEVKAIENHANNVNTILKNAFTKDRYDTSYDITKYGANIETHTYVTETLKGHINWWINNYKIVADAEEEGYNAELYNLVNHNVYEGYVADFEAEVATLRAAADEFIAAVEAIENVNLDSKATLDAAKVLFDVVSKGQKLVNLDTILGLDDIYDEDGELVEEVTNVSEAYDAWLTQYARFNRLVKIKNDLEDAAKATLVKCTFDHGTDKEGNKLPCDGKDQCAKVGTYDYTKFVVKCEDNTHGKMDANGELIKCDCFDDRIVEIIAMYELDETVFDAELLTVYKMYRLQDTLAEVTQNLEDAYAASAKDAKAQALKGIIEEEIKAVAANYTFAAEFTCQYPDVKDHECHCAEDLNNWAMAIEGEPAEALAEKYTEIILKDRFGK